MVLFGLQTGTSRSTRKRREEPLRSLTEWRRALTARTILRLGNVSVVIDLGRQKPGDELCAANMRSAALEPPRTGPTRGNSRLGPGTLAPRSPDGCAEPTACPRKPGASPVDNSPSAPPPRDGAAMSNDHCVAGWTRTGNATRGCPSEGADHRRRPPRLAIMWTMTMRRLRVPARTQKAAFACRMSIRRRRCPSKALDRVFPSRVRPRFP